MERITKYFLNRIARKNMRKFFDIVDDIAKKQGKFFPLLLDIPPPKTEEEKETERKFVEEEKQIHAYKEQYSGEILALTRREGEIVLLAHALLEKELLSKVDTIINQGLFDTESELMFFR